MMVFTDVGLRQLTRIRCGARSLASVRISPTTPCLAAYIVGDVLIGLQPSCGTGEDDRSASPALDEVRDCRLAGVPHTGEVDVDHALPRVLRHVLRREGRRGDAGVAAHNVQPTELATPSDTTSATAA